MIKTEFELNIINQYWMEPAEYDLCSHGEIYLKVKDKISTEPGVNESWGISESALALLRTLDENIQSNPVDGDVVWLRSRIDCQLPDFYPLVSQPL